MITPRRTRLLRVPSLSGLRQVLTDIIGALDPVTADATFIVVPTRAAGEQLRRTVEDRLLDGRPALAWPHVGPRTDLYRELFARTNPPVETLPAFDREVILGRLARQVAAAGLAPPFAIRPALVAEILVLYDFVRRQARTVEDFSRNLCAELEPAVESDRGAARLLEQTRFLSAVFGGYEAHLAHHGLLDEHTARARLVTGTAGRPLRRVVVAVGDRLAEGNGLWPVDFTLLSTLPGLDELDVVATESMLASGLLERIHAVLPDLDEAQPVAGPPPEQPRLVVPSSDAVVMSARDREEELADAARRIKSAHRTGTAAPLHRHALVVRRPLPYLYLARAVLGGAGLPFETLDTLPLAAEPYAAALDLVLDLVASDFSRAALVALLRSPHFRFEAEAETEISPALIDTFDRALADARFLGGRDRLVRLADDWTALEAAATRDQYRQRRAGPAARLAVGLAEALSPLAEPHPVPGQLTLLQQFLNRHHRIPSEGERPRGARVRRAVTSALAALARAYSTHDPDATASGLELSSAIRRWLGAQTFAAGTGQPGIRILDTQAARFADVDDVQLMGLVEGEWPEPARRSIFYPPSLLAHLEPSPAAVDPNRREGAVLAAARAEFLDLLLLGRSQVRVSTFSLEADAVVEPSPFADDLAASGLVRQPDDLDRALEVFTDEALLAEPPRVEALPPPVEAWARVRAARVAQADPRYSGEAGPWSMPRVSVSRIDRYLKCPFQFFSSEVLELEEEPRDEDAPPPWERGRFLHALFEAFFRAWQDRGHRGIAPDRIPEARAMLTELAEQALSTLSPSEAVLERLRLFGSAAGAGIVDRVLSMEAERPDPIERRLIEYELDGPFEFRRQAGGSRTVRLRAKVDRVDLLSGGRFRVIDYKSKAVPDPKRTVQLQVYASAVAQQQAREGASHMVPSEAFYLSMEGDAPIRALKPAKGDTLDDLLRGAEDRMVQAIDDIAAGHFPVRPALRSLCSLCPFDQVCRKAYVEGADD